MPDFDSESVSGTHGEEMIAEPETARDVMRRVIGWLNENAAGRPAEEQRDLARHVGIVSGLYAAEYPAVHGGRSIPQRIAVELREEAAASGLPFSNRILCDDEGPSRLLMDATPEQKACWLRPLIEGRMTRCLAMTEERGGSDLSDLYTVATQSADGWQISGRKFLISNAAEADIAIVLANVIGGRVSGPTFFIFSTNVRGWNVVRRLPGMDPLLNQYEVELKSISVTDSTIIGGPGRIGGAAGMTLERSAYGRVALAARAIGLSRWALSVARRHAAQRTVGGVRLSEKQYIREFIVRSYLKIETSRSLVGRAAVALDDGRLAVAEAALAKLHATESACEIIDDAMQVLGGRGWLSEYGLEQAYREARSLRIVDGTSEVLKETIFHLMPAAGGQGRRS